MKTPLNLITSLPKFGGGIGHHRMVKLCSDILKSNWNNNIDSINVVGTNGKGSTTIIISNILMELGLTVGQFTSPHLFEFNERICINNNQISSKDLARFAEIITKKSIALKFNTDENQLSAFEAFTCLSLSYFHENETEVIVLEAGIGGRHDPTRVLTGSFTALTSIDLDHTKILGSTKEIIAYDKIDIAKENTTVVVGALDPQLLRRLEVYANYKNLTLLPIADNTEVLGVSFQEDQMNLSCTVEDYSFPNLLSNVVGYHQVNNILVSILLVKRWLTKNYPQLEKEEIIRAIYRSLSSVICQGRLQKIHSKPSIFIDSAHTPHAIKLLVRSFKEINKSPCILIIGVSHDKEVRNIVSELVPIADIVVCTKAHHKGSDASVIYEMVDEINNQNKPVHRCSNIEESIDFSLSLAKENNMTILVAGGLFLATEAHHYVKGKSPRDLSFF